ncbi:MAG: DUF4846 domain-containing protein [Panacibacter sp.]
MKKRHLVSVALLILTIILIIGFNNFSIRPEQKKIPGINLTNTANAIELVNTVGEIPVPLGFEKIDPEKQSFAEWLQNIPLKKDNTVYLFNGKPKDRQDLHYRVLDISTGSKDLQQCADCIMRLQAEYYFERKEYNKISFPGGDGTKYNFELFAQKQHSCYTHECLLKFLETVFNYCGTYTIGKITKPISLNQMQVGDILLKAGSPGHTMIVVNMAVNKSTGQKLFLLAQGYMPAQDMHIVINPTNEKLSPWYELGETSKIITPGWIFESNQLRR